MLRFRVDTPQLIYAAFHPFIEYVENLLILNASMALPQCFFHVLPFVSTRSCVSHMWQENKGVEDFGDIIREGGGALAKGLFRGVTGILTKPLEGAKSSGVEGFVSGFGKGIIGAAAQPVSGVLDLLSKTTEGANAMRMKIAAAITSDEQLLRRRLPRAVGADSLLRPYNEYRAQGQVHFVTHESTLACITLLVFSWLVDEE